MTGQLSELELIRVSAVLHDCVDQLAVLGNIMPESYMGRAGAAMKVVSTSIDAALEQQKGAEQFLKTARESPVEEDVLSKAMKELLKSQRNLNRVLDENPLSPENLAKVQRDREFVAHVMSEIMAELQEKGTFHALFQVVEMERKRKTDLQDIISREEESRLKVKTLQKQLLNIRKEQTMELEKCDEIIAHMKDQLQEKKMKTSMERKYIKISTALLINEHQKRNYLKENEEEDEIKTLQLKLWEEERANAEMKCFYKKHQEILGDKLEYWMERYEKDMEDKQQEIQTLTTKRNNNVAQIQELAKKYRESETVIIEDRLEKKKLLEELEREKRERKAATKIQAWWRGNLVRKGLGPYKKTKKPKTKEGKKGKRKKK